MVYVGMDVHSKTTTFCLYDPGAEPSRQYRYMTRPTTAKEIEAVLEPLGGDCRIAYEVGTQAQWVADIVRPLALDVQVANPSRIPWLFRSGKKNDRADAKKLATLLYLDQLPFGAFAVAGRFGLAGDDRLSSYHWSRDGPCARIRSVRSCVRLPYDVRTAVVGRTKGGPGCGR